MIQESKFTLISLWELNAMRGNQPKYLHKLLQPELLQGSIMRPNIYRSRKNVKHSLALKKRFNSVIALHIQSYLVLLMSKVNYQIFSHTENLFFASLINIISQYRESTNLGILDYHTSNLRKAVVERGSTVLNIHWNRRQF